MQPQTMQSNNKSRVVVNLNPLQICFVVTQIESISVLLDLCLDGCTLVCEVNGNKLGVFLRLMLPQQLNSYNVEKSGRRNSKHRCWCFCRDIKHFDSNYSSFLLLFSVWCLHSRCEVNRMWNNLINTLLYIMVQYHVIKGKKNVAIPMF